MSSKIYFLPAVFNSHSASPKTIAFWRKINQLDNSQPEVHLFLVFEGRNTAETHQLGREFWKIASGYTTEAILNQQAFLNPEQTCESIIKLFNDYFLAFREKNPVQNWNEFHLIVGIATGNALFFTRLGDARLVFFRDQNIFVADEDLAPNRSPHFQPPLSEIAEGNLHNDDRILIATPALSRLFSLEDLASLVNPQNFFGAFGNIVKSIEIAKAPANASFLWGEVSPANPQKEAAIQKALGAKIKKTQFENLHFWEFNLFDQPIPAKETFKSDLLPWGKIIRALSSAIVSSITTVGKIIAYPLRPIFQKIASLSPLRKAILLSSFFVFLVYLGYVSFSILNQPKPDVASVDYQAAFSEAEKLRQEAQSALIYQDEEKARKNLAQAVALLDQATHSGECGIKALKMKQEIEEELAGLEKTENANSITKIWPAPAEKGLLKKLSWVKNGTLLLAAEKWTGEIKIADSNVTPEDYQKSQLDLSGQSPWLLKSQNRFLLILLQKQLMVAIDPGNKTITEAKSLGGEFKEKFSTAAAFNNNIYFFDPKENEIKLFAYENENLTFKRNWLKPEFRDEFKDNPITSLAVDGSIYALSRDGQIKRFSGGKKTSWKAEDSTTKVGGERGGLLTNAALKNLYVLDPANKKIIVYEKETGKLKSQIQNSSLGQAADFQVDEGKKEMYFITSSVLFKFNFEP